ncbi:MAG: enoyl-CoA hydratase/isomerase family protein [Planctomycetes bacterium]|nr:enoyl-CoA hydratase/isomerase family protein [Planctomycetota bacterium]
MSEKVTASPLRVEINGRVARVTLCRPAARNALDPSLCAELTRFFRQAGREAAVQVIVLAGEGPAFSAGADLEWMRRVAGFTEAENVADALVMSDLFSAVDECPRVVVGRVQGAALGGGLGLLACCDCAVAASDAFFSFSEVRLALLPAVISPYVLRRIGTGHARELFLSGERFTAEQARAIGLVHHVVSPDQLDAEVQRRVEAFLEAAPDAQAEAKALIRRVAGRNPGDLREELARWLARRRASEEGQEGIRAFLEKRRPRWPASPASGDARAVQSGGSDRRRESVPTAGQESGQQRKSAEDADER